MALGPSHEGELDNTFPKKRLSVRIVCQKVKLEAQIIQRT